MSLSNPEQAVLGTPSTAQIVIQDDRAATAPTGLQALGVGAQHIRLTWTDRCTNEEEFVVERSSGGPFQAVGTVAANVTHYVDGVGLVETFTYRVRARRASEDLTSEPSNEATASTTLGGFASIKPNRIKFQTLKVGKVKRAVVTIKNGLPRGGPLRGYVGSLPAPYFVISGGGFFQVMPRKTHKVTVEYRPTKAATSKAVLQITTTDASSPLIPVSVSGRAR